MIAQSLLAALLCLATLFARPLLATPEDLVATPQSLPLAQLPLTEFERMPLATYEVHHLILLIGAAQQMVRDTALAVQDRGYICYNLVADELQRRSKMEDFDPNEAAVQFLLAQLAAEQYHLALSRPSDWEKLWHYMQEGRWAYITQRFFDRGMHIPSGLVLLVGTFALVGIRRRRQHLR